MGFYTVVVQSVLMGVHAVQNTAPCRTTQRRHCTCVGKVDAFFDKLVVIGTLDCRVIVKQLVILHD